MDTRFLGIDNIAHALGLSNHKVLQCYYESALKERETLDLNIEGFEWADPQIDFNYEFLEAQGYIKGMATYTDRNSQALPRGRKAKLQKYSGTIPQMKRLEVYGENDYRAELIEANKAAALASMKGEAPASSVKEYLWNNLFDRMKEFPDSFNASLSYQVGQMKSKRAITLTTDNNPGGISGVTFSSSIPEQNVVKKSWWTTNAAGVVTYNEDVDPVQILMEKVYELNYDPIRGYQNAVIEMDNTTFLRLIKHPKVLQRIGFAGQLSLVLSNQKDKASAQSLGWEKIMSNGVEFAKTFLQTAIGVSAILVNNTVVGVDKLNSTTKNFDTEAISVFEKDVILVRPSGIIGQIFNAVPLRPDTSAVFADLYGGRGLVEYIYNPTTREQTWRAELTALAVPTMPKKLFYYEVGGVTPTA